MPIPSTHLHAQLAGEITIEYQSVVSLKRFKVFAEVVGILLRKGGCSHGQSRSYAQYVSFVRIEITTVVVSD